jgi:hypothetical protein
MKTENQCITIALGRVLRCESIFVVTAILLFWSVPGNAGGRWIDADKEACPDVCKADKGEGSGAAEQNAVPIGGRHQYYVCAGHVVGSPPKDERGGSNDGTACIVADHSGAQTLERYKCLCTSDKVDGPFW